MGWKWAGNGPARTPEISVFRPGSQGSRLVSFPCKHRSQVGAGLVPVWNVETNFVCVLDGQVSVTVCDRLSVIIWLLVECLCLKRRLLSAGVIGYFLYFYFFILSALDFLLYKQPVYKQLIFRHERNLATFEAQISVVAYKVYCICIFLLFS